MENLSLSLFLRGSVPSAKSLDAEIRRPCSLSVQGNRPPSSQVGNAAAGTAAPASVNPRPEMGEWWVRYPQALRNVEECVRHMQPRSMEETGESLYVL